MNLAEPGVIKKLDEVVVNRIAAGEVIQRPANALKELLENSLDAQSTNIQVTLKSGGLKLLQIQDNGTGIRKEDLSIVCERFTTSKLQKFEDLTTIATFGFRGEALASISHVAHLTITTKSRNQQCAFKAQYEDGKLKGPPKPCAGNQGTLICAEDLFYNIATRKRVLKNPNEEFVKIADVVGKYAVHNPSVGFVLKRIGETISDIKTSPSSHSDVIKSIYGDTVAKELLTVDFKDPVLNFEVHGLITNANYSTKKPVFILFINNRLVDSTALRKTIEREYAIHLPNGTHPFVYLGMTLDPKNVDVNVHPTKHEVLFLHEDEIIESTRKAVESILLGSNKSRVFYTQAKLPGVNVDSENAVLEKSNAKVRDNVLVRTDPSMQKIDKFFHSHGDDPSTSKKESTNSFKRREMKLTSVLKMKREIEVECSLALREIIAESSYVGVAEREEVLVQHSTSLYMFHLETLKEELFYQLMVFDFGNYGAIKFAQPLPLKDLIAIGLEDPEMSPKEKSEPVDIIYSRVIETFRSKKEMLLDYFSIEINDNCICTIPLLLENYLPDMGRLPRYILRLAGEVNWKAEGPCFGDVCRETALFYSYCDHNTDYEKYKWNVEHVVYPAIKKHLLPHKKLANDKSITELISLPTLYKVFERC